MPLFASATATFLFRQFFLTIPDELAEAARIDGAGPMRFFWDVVVPLSRTNIAALFVILFIFGWNQYLWPLLVTTDESMYTTVIGIKRMIAGGEAATEWNRVMTTAILAMLPPALVAMVFQNYALYPHMSVFDNMAYGLKIRGLPKDDIGARVKRAAEILELGPLLERKPRQLSGGQRQRVAMGRAIVREPAVFLFDEP